MPKTSTEMAEKANKPREPRETKQGDKPDFQFKDWAAL